MITKHATIIYIYAYVVLEISEYYLMDTIIIMYKIESTYLSFKQYNNCQHTASNTINNNNNNSVFVI